MPDDLDQLSDTILSERFAVEVVGWDLLPAGYPQFARDANAVLPFLEKHIAWSKGTVGTAVDVYGQKLSPAPKPDGVPDSEWMIIYSIGHHWNETKPPVPFARAACIALIRAKRFESNETIGSKA